MNRTHHLYPIRRLASALAGLAAALLAVTTAAAAPAAYASLPPHGGGPAGTYTTVRVIATGGMPGWQITLIAAVTALAAATVAVLIDRARAARKTHATTV
jgi:hypothetical protein